MKRKIDLVVAGYIFNKKRVLLVEHGKLRLWLPVGGHIKENETSDDALLREAREEVNLEIKILNQSRLPSGGNIEKKLAVPFDCNLHSVGNHYHCCFFYVARALNPTEIRTNHELKNYGWFSEKGLYKSFILEEVRNQALMAFKIFEKLNRK